MDGVAPKQFLTVTEPAGLQVLGAGVLRIGWSLLTTVTNLTGTLEFTDPDAVTDSRRFYRTVLR
jgi:hypothetical protein